MEIYGDYLQMETSSDQVNYFYWHIIDLSRGKVCNPNSRKGTQQQLTDLPTDAKKGVMFFTSKFTTQVSNRR